MAKAVEIARIREFLTDEENVWVADDVINEAIEMGRLRGSENDAQFVTRIIRAALRKGLRPS